MSDPIPRTDPALLAVARGDAPADLVLAGARVVNVFTREIHRASVGLVGGRIAAIDQHVEGVETIDLGDAYIAPGFIDAHMHVESTLMGPRSFVPIAAAHGTTGVVLDPHEIANVLGVPGIRMLMDEAAPLPMNIWFAASSCVPASPLETAGAVLEAEDLRPLMDDPRVVALAEMMNFPGVVHAVPEVLAKVAMGLEHGPVDGHCPGLHGRALQAYVAAGIGSEHECVTREEAEARLRLGMRVYIREGSAARNLEALLPLVTPANAHRFCFCTDDRHPRDLMDEGHIDHVVRKAIGLGLDPATAIAMATRHPAEHFGRRDSGAIAPGCFADLLVIDDLSTLRVRDVYFRGRRIVEDAVFVAGLPPAAADEAIGADTVHLPAGLDESSFSIDAGTGATLRVIGMDPHQIVTGDLRMPGARDNGHWVADPGRDLLKLAVIERHGGAGGIGLGFVHGFGLRDGAIASTVGHDAHNLIIAGANDRDMLLAARALADAGGGQCVVRDGVVQALLPLPVAGLLSREPVETIVQQQTDLAAAAAALGCPHHDPFMPLSFLPLSVIPALKLSDRGLIDVSAFQLVPLEADP